MDNRCIPIALPLEMSRQEWATDRHGNDYRKINNRKSFTVTDCQEECDSEHEKCISWTYLVAGIQGDNPVCYLKDKWGELRQMGGAFSGATMVDPEYKSYEVNIDRPGGDYKCIRHLSSIQACQNQCMIEDKCKSWTSFKRSDGTRSCCLKSSVQSKRTKTDCYSGAK